MHHFLRKAVLPPMMPAAFITCIMRNICITPVMCMLLIMMTLMLPLQAALAADFGKLVILHTNDTHGYDEYGEGHNGMAVIARLRQRLEADGYQVLLLDAGDAIQDNNLVNFSKGKSAIQFMNAAGYDAAAIGNHEFDYGQDVLQERMAEALFPYVAANIRVEATGKNFVRPYTIIQKNDLKIGILGLTTPQTITSTSPKNVRGLTFLQGRELWQAAEAAAKELRAQGCDLVIALGHLGSMDNDMGSSAEEVLAHTSGIDIFIDGHDHQVKNKYVGDTLLAETGYYTNNIGCIVHEEGRWTEKMIAFGEYTEENPQVKLLIQTARDQVSASLGQMIGKSLVALDGSRAPGVRTMETNAGDFCADAVLWQANSANVLDAAVDAAICNGGGIRSGIAAGDVTRGMLYSMNPYNNQLYVVKITGSKLLEILEAATAYTPEAMGSFPQVAGISYAVNTAAAYEKGEPYPNSGYYAPALPGSRVTIESVGNRPFQPDAIYSIAMIEFLASGGDTYAGLCLPGATLDCRSIGYLDAEALENYLTEELHGVIGTEYAEAQARIKIK
ncbi:MAG: bifunctional metallophosphatase/5'-nucleotidase [Selenomonadaceae bacterium]|nr:bifunctional metallophosphatase/5'-nucleotidase [Selenomonadaceae bacterium]